MSEGDLIKIDNVKLMIHDEENLRQFLVLKRDALKGFQVEGMEVNNLIMSMLQDYAYTLNGTIRSQDTTGENTQSIIIKIPTEMQSEFENRYNINDLLIGHVSIVGIYKGTVQESSITSNTFTFFQDAKINQNDGADKDAKIIKSNGTSSYSSSAGSKVDDIYHFVDTLAIIQDVSFKLEDKPAKKMHF